jgi:predicted TIM-barrel fold metal-dependent hydrolase
LPYILSYAGEDNLVIGTDYGHADTASEISALRELQHNGQVNSEAVKKILDDNPRALYGL